MNTSQNVWEIVAMLTQLPGCHILHKDRVAGSSNKTHQRDLAANDMSIDTEENNSSQLGISSQLAGQGVVGTQQQFVETPTFCAICEKGAPVPGDKGPILHDTLYAYAVHLHPRITTFTSSP